MTIKASHSTVRFISGCLLACSLAALPIARAVADDAPAGGNGTSAAPAGGNSAAPATGNDSATTPSQVAPETGTTAAAPPTFVQGGIKGTAVPFDEGIARIGLATAAIKEETELIMREATRKDTVVFRGPNVLPGGVVIPAVGGAGGVMQFGEMPMRKNKLDRWVADTENNIAALQSYVDALILPPEKTTQAEPIYKDLRTAMQFAADHLVTLKELSSQKRLNNGKIGKQALLIYDTMTHMETDRRQLAELTDK